MTYILGTSFSRKLCKTTSDWCPSHIVEDVPHVMVDFHTFDRDESENPTYVITCSGNDDMAIVKTYIDKDMAEEQYNWLISNEYVDFETVHELYGFDD